MTIDVDGAKAVAVRTAFGLSIFAPARDDEEGPFKGVAELFLSFDEDARTIEALRRLLR